MTNFFNLPGGRKSNRGDQLEHANQLLQAGDAAFERQNIEEGLLFYQDAFVIKAGQMGIEHAEVQRMVERLCRWLAESNSYVTARQFFAQSLHEEEVLLSPAARHLPFLVDAIGNQLSSQEKMSEALSWFKLAQEGFERVFGLESRPVLYTLQKEVGLLYNQGDLPGARAALERILSIDEHVVGPEHPRVAADLISLARINREMGALEEASACYTRAVTIYEKSSDPVDREDDARLVEGLTELGRIKFALREYPEARAYFERVLALDEQTFGKVHPKIANDLAELVNTVQQQNDWQAAHTLLERILAIDEQIYGPENEKIVADLEKLAQSHWRLGDAPAAAQTYQKALTLSQTRFGPQHPKIAAICRQFGDLLRDTGDLSGAKRLYDSAIAVLEKILPSDHPDLLALQNARTQIP